MNRLFAIMMGDGGGRGAQQTTYVYYPTLGMFGGAWKQTQTLRFTKTIFFYENKLKNSSIFMAFFWKEKCKIYVKIFYLYLYLK